jgi:hypothetical protein
MKKIIVAIVVCSVVLYSCGSKTQQISGNVSVYTAPDDAAIKKAVDDAYASLTYKKGDDARLDSIIRYFIPQATLINYIGDTAQILSISDFVKAYKNYIKTTNIQSFREQEIYGRTDQFGNIAQRISAYKTYVNSSDFVKERGVNSFQLIKTPEGWKVSSIIWQVEKTGLDIPQYYLGK